MLLSFKKKCIAEVLPIRFFIVSPVHLTLSDYCISNSRLELLLYNMYYRYHHTYGRIDSWEHPVGTLLLSHCIQSGLAQEKVSSKCLLTTVLLLTKAKLRLVLVVLSVWTMYQALPFVKKRNLYSGFFKKFSMSYHSFLVVSQDSVNWNIVYC